MAVATETTNVTPFVKFNRIGDTLVGALASDPSKSQRQVQNYTDGKPVFKSDGRPLLEEVMHLIAMPGTTARVGNTDDGFAEIEDQAHVRHSLRGFKWGQVIDARREMPAGNGFKQGQVVSSDVYEFRLVGWSAETKNPQAAKAAGFTVVDDRVVLRSEDEKDKYILAQSSRGGNTNPAKDFEVTARRIRPEEKAYEKAADELYMSKPWERATGGGEQITGSAGGVPNDSGNGEVSAADVDPWAAAKNRSETQSEPPF